MSNLLHKLLLEMNYPARIVHLRGDRKGHIHTLVEVDIAGETFLADPQENFMAPMRVEDLIESHPQDFWPAVWTGMNSAYEFIPRKGYVSRPVRGRD
jgi:hypothetical protein